MNSKTGELFAPGTQRIGWAACDSWVFSRSKHHLGMNFHAEIHWQTADGDIVTTYKTYYGTHQGNFLGVEPTGRKIHFETVDAMRVHNGKITEHWGVANLFSVMQQLDACPDETQRKPEAFSSFDA